MITTRLGTALDIEGILDLQSENLFTNLTKKEREQGFVTTPFVESQILDIIKEDGLFVAESNGKIVSYVYAGSWDYFQQWEIFNFMVARFPNLSFEGQKISTKNTFQYGPICIAKEYRGQGLMNRIFEEMRLTWLKKHPISITFINAVNTISERAHEKLGWEVIDRFEFNGNQYLGLRLDMKISVL